MDLRTPLPFNALGFGVSVTDGTWQPPGGVLPQDPDGAFKPRNGNANPRSGVPFAAVAVHCTPGAPEKCPLPGVDTEKQTENRCPSDKQHHSAEGTRLLGRPVYEASPNLPFLHRRAQQTCHVCTEDGAAPPPGDNCDPAMEPQGVGRGDPTGEWGR